MATGSGRTLGRALVDLFAHGGKPGGARSTYDRVGWQAQFSQLSKTKAGYAAMEAAGLSATIRTQRAWLTGDATASPINRGRIAEAYKSMQGGFDSRLQTAVLKISGRVTQGQDSRERGRGRSAPLRVDGNNGRWDRIEAIWNAGADPDDIETQYIEDVVDRDLGEGSYPWEFDGNWYEVST